MNKTRREKRNRRRQHIRKSVVGTNDIPRLSVFRSNKYLFVQICDDEAGLCKLGLSEKTMMKDSKSQPLERAAKMGEKYAELLKKNKVSKIVFDRGGYKYHGRVKAFADAMRESGINF